MTNTLFALVDMARSALHCVWIETGDPRQPLACVWIDRDLRIAEDDDGSRPEECALETEKGMNQTNSVAVQERA